MLLPRKQTPSLDLSTLDHGEFSLSTENPKNFSLIVFYRGLHCPLCIKYLTELGRLLPDFQKRGVNVIAISSDEQERARQITDRIKTTDLRIGYGLDLKKAREWGLYISASKGKTSIGIEEPELFSEPAVYILRPDGTLYYGNVQTMPFARPIFSELLGAIDFALANDYPARGEYQGEV